MMVRSGVEHPFHFGTSALFGLYHPPRQTGPKGAVLLCPPIGLDQIRSHRLYRQLAQALADDGFAVLRYDCRGTGDSPGESVEVDWRQCIADTVCAADELRRLSGCRELTAFGARLGGSLALVAAMPARFVRLIVWDAVLDGSSYVTQMDTSQEQLRHDPDRFRVPRSMADAAGQWVGFPVGTELRADLAALRIESSHAPVVLLQSASTEAGAGHTCSFVEGAQTERLSVRVPWSDLSALEETILSPELIQAVRAALRETV